ncbi:MAG: hypothetical protein HKN04_11920 [Rhodothermaceae bacterium]|nr:hypothetical protein [Rhodothermaceae bacterium]
MRTLLALLAPLLLGATCATIPSTAQRPAPLESDLYYTGSAAWWAQNADLACESDPPPDPYDPIPQPRKIRTLKLCAQTTKSGGLTLCHVAQPATCYRFDGGNGAAGTLHLIPGTVRMECQNENRLQVWDPAHMPDWGDVTDAACELDEIRLWGR